MSKLYRAGTAYRKPQIYRGGFAPAKPYRSGTPYRKPQTYRGLETAAEVGPPTRGSGGAGRWRRPNPHSALNVVRFDQAQAGAAAAAATIGEIAGRHAEMVRLTLLQALSHAGSASLAWGEFRGHYDAAWRALWGSRAHGQQGAAIRWADIAHAHLAATHVPWRALDPRDLSAGVAWGGLASRAITASALWRAAAQLGAFVSLPWSPMHARTGGVDIVWPVEPGEPGDTITVPILPVYVMLPTLTAVRLPDRAPLPLLSASVSGEQGSWAWTLSAPMSRDGLALIDDGTGTPTEIELAINGHVWTFLIDGYDDMRRFGSNTCQIRGRSRSAALAEPYARTRTYTETEPRNASQLAAAEVEGSGWTLIWDAVDWLVPGGTFSYQDLAPIDAIAQLANSIGAGMSSDPEQRTLRVAPGYPESPWSWPAAEPYAVLPAAVLTEGSSSWVGGVNANGVYVYGEGSGTGALVRIAGSDGAQQLPMIVDKLAVTHDAQRERGRVELAGAGIKRTMQRSLPLFPPAAGSNDPALGAVPIGSLVEVEDVDESWRGQVMAVRIDAQRSGGALTVRQHLTIERQYR